MENRAHAIVAVGFLIVFSVGAVLIFYWLSSGPGEPRLYRIVTRQSVAGLAPQSRVMFKGVLVGHVEHIGFDPEDRSRVIIDFRVQPDAYITQATYAVPAMKGLIGGKVLKLKLGEGSRQPLATSAADPAHIPLREGMVAQLKQAARDNLAALHAVLAGVHAILDKNNREHIGATLRQLDTLTAKLVELEDQLAPAAGKLPQLLANMQQVVSQADVLLANADKLVRQMRGPVNKAGAVEDTIQRVGDRLDALLPAIHVLVKDLTRTSRQLRGLARELQARPQSLIFGPPAPRPGPGEPGFRPGR